LVSITHEQNIICSKTHFAGTTHEQFVGSYLQVIWWALGQYKRREKKVLIFFADESWDVDVPKSPSIGSHKKNNSGMLSDREQAASQLQNKESTTDEQENPNDVHDFFDS